MKKQVLSIEQMQELTELGIDTSKASMCWMTYPSLFNENKRAKELVINNNTNKHYFYIVSAAIDCTTVLEIPAFTLQDILEILSTIKKVESKQFIATPIIRTECTECWAKVGLYTDAEGWEIHSEYNEIPSLLESAFKMLKWCLENKYI